MGHDQAPARRDALQHTRVAAMRYGLAGAYVMGVYLVIVGGVGGVVGADPSDVWLVSVAALTIAVTLPLASRQSERVALRLVYGVRPRAELVLGSLHERAGPVSGIEEATDELARVAAEVTGAARAEIWLRLADRFERSATWPPGQADVLPASTVDQVAARAGADHVVAVRSHDEPLGVITVASGARPLVPGAERALGALAVAAGLLIRNARSAAALADRLAQLQRHAAELHDSRRQAVAAHDRERRRIERDIHDGAQNYLVALLVQMRLARQSIDDAPREAEAALTELGVLAESTLTRVAELTRGLDPPLLRERGVLAALWDLPLARHVEIQGTGRGRLSLEVETAVYFAVLEAIQNAVKHAGASRVRVFVDSGTDALAFRVDDDGVGFDVASTHSGAGLQSIARRLDEVGGRVSVVSSPGRGTTVAGAVEQRTTL